MSVAGGMAAHALAVGHNRRALLSGIDLAIAPGECWAVVGRNGTGKSTLLATLAGLLPPLSGEVTVAGQPLRAWPRPRLALQLGYLPQHQTAVFPYTVEEFVAFGRLPWRQDRAGSATAVEQALRDLDLTALRARPLTGLSGGEVQRVCIAQLLAQTTGILLLDEPLAHLDLLHQVAVMRLLRGLAAAGRALVVVTHDLGLAWRYCDRLLVLGPGGCRRFAPGDPQAAAALAWAYDVEFEVNSDGPRLRAPQS